MSAGPVSADAAAAGAAAAGPSLQPVRRLDPETLIAEIAEFTGVRLDLLGPAPGGQVGAAFVRRPDGRPGVLTWWGQRSRDDLWRLRLTAEVLDLARTRGIPAPAYELIVGLPQSMAIVQERLPGSPPVRNTLALTKAMVAACESFGGLLADRTDVAVPEMFLDRSAEGFCIHESLERYDRRTRRLLSRIREIGRAEPRRMTGDDLVHLDFHAGNVLVDATGALTGIVDWDGLGRGDRYFGLVTLRFDLASPQSVVDPDAAPWLDELLEQVLDPAVLRLYWAHMSLRMVDWSIRHFDASEVTHWLEFATTHLD